MEFVFASGSVGGVVGSGVGAAGLHAATTNARANKMDTIFFFMCFLLFVTFDITLKRFRDWWIGDMVVPLSGGSEAFHSLQSANCAERQMLKSASLCQKYLLP